MQAMNNPLDLFVKYLGEQYLGIIKQEDIMDGIPDDAGVYRVANMVHCWALYVPELIPRVGAGRLVAISKDTGKVVCDQVAGE
jgi:hypothetical protein